MEPEPAPASVAAPQPAASEDDGAPPHHCAAAAPADAAADAAAAAAALPPEGKRKRQTKRKVAVHLAYLGAGYAGMQRNPGARTIEGELEAALVKAGAISEANAGSFQKIHWNRAARTDKGVSAVCQVVSAKLVVEPAGSFVERVNAALPDQVVVFGVQRATEGFDARKFCDKRRYEYCLPAWAFDPQVCIQSRAESIQASKQRASSSAAASGGGAKSSSKARLADEAAALAVIAAAVMAAPPADDAADAEAAPADAAAAPADAAPAAEAAAAAAPAAEAAAAAAPAAEAAAAAAAAAEAAAALAAGAAGGGSSGKQQQQQQQKQQAPDLQNVHDQMASTSAVGGEEIHRLKREVEASRQRYVFGEAQLERLNGLLAKYEGTHNFHNFTVRVAGNDPAARRYMLSVRGEVFEVAGQPWVRIVLIGQSFMLHQIRKMVGLVLAVMRGVAPDETIALALEPDRDVLTPMAPELGLFLDETCYDAYNTRFGELHGPVTFEPYRAAAATFKDAVLYPHIAELDDRELINALWLRGCTEAQFRFSTWATRPKVRQATPYNGSQAAAGGWQQQKQQAPAGGGGRGRGHAEGPGGSSNKRKQGMANGAGGPGGAAAGSKFQRLERPGKHEGASAAMVVGVQETYGMHPHSDTPAAAAARAELKAMREEHAAVMEQQQQQAEQPMQAEPTQEELDAELEGLYA